MKLTRLVALVATLIFSTHAAAQTVTQVNPHRFAPAGSPAIGNVVAMNGFDHESAPRRKWGGLGASSGTAATGVTGAHGRVLDSASNRLSTTLPATYSTVSAGARVQFRADASQDFIRLGNGTDLHVMLYHDAGGGFSVRRNTVVVGGAQSAGGVLTQNTWYYCEVSAVIHDTTGNVTAKCHADGGGSTVTISATGVDTKDGASTGANSILVGGENIDTYIDDVWVDSSGALHGRAQVETLYPAGAGDAAVWNRSGADSGANWSQCDEAVANDATDGVLADTIGDDDLYAFGNRSVTGTVVAVQTTGQGTANTQQYKHLLKIGGTIYPGSVTHTLAATATNPWEAWPTNPATGFAWGDAEIDAMQAGLRAVTATPALSQVVVEVLVKLP